MKVHCAAVVFHVADVRASLDFYTNVLGFEKDFEYGTYVGVRKGDALVHLSANSDNVKPVGAGHIYIFCDEVDSYFDEVTAKGATVRKKPQDYPYGMRDFDVEDVDGNFLVFGCESKA